MVAPDHDELICICNNHYSFMARLLRKKTIYNCFDLMGIQSLSVRIFTSDVNECDSNPCRNGGTCVDAMSKYTCSCKTGFSGTHCEHGRYMSQLYTCACRGDIHFYYDYGYQ